MTITLAWSEYHEYRFVLNPIDGSPSKSNGSNLGRWEVTVKGTEIGRITKAAENEFAAYTYAGYGEFNKCVGYYDTMEAACKDLMATWEDYLEWGNGDPYAVE